MDVASCNGVLRILLLALASALAACCPQSSLVDEIVLIRIPPTLIASPSARR